MSYGQKNVFWGQSGLWPFDHQNLISSFLRYCIHKNGTEIRSQWHLMTMTPLIWCLIRSGYLFQVWRNSFKAFLRYHIHKTGMTWKHNASGHGCLQVFQKIVNHRGPSADSHECAQKNCLNGTRVCKISCRQASGPLVTQAHKWFAKQLSMIPCYFTNYIFSHCFNVREIFISRTYILCVYMVYRLST